MFNLTDRADINEHIDYTGVISRLSKLYGWLDADHTINDEIFPEICKRLTGRLEKIVSSNDIKMSPGEVHINKTGEYGQYIEFPPCYFSLPEYDTLMECKIHINPCSRTGNIDDKTHHSKVWVSISNAKSFKMNGDSIKNLLDQGRAKSQEIAKIVGDQYTDVCSEVTTYNQPEVLETYWIAIDTILIDPTSLIDKGIKYLLSVSDDEIFEKTPMALGTLSDMANWIYGKKPENPIKFINENMDKETTWKTGVTPDANVFYIKRNTDGFFHILGVGHPSDINNSNPYQVDNIHKPRMAGIITAL